MVKHDKTYKTLKFLGIVSWSTAAVLAIALFVL